MQLLTEEFQELSDVLVSQDVLEDFTRISSRLMSIFHWPVVHEDGREYFQNVWSPF